MASELEKKFFDTFGIEPKEPIYITMNCDCGCHDCKNCEKYKNNYLNIYPQITDHILLELICIATSSEITVEFKGIKNVEHLKEVILNYCIKRYGYCLHKDKFKYKVRTLF